MAINCKTPTVMNIAEYLLRINPTYRALLVTVTAFIISLHGFLFGAKSWIKLSFVKEYVASTSALCLPKYHPA